MTPELPAPPSGCDGFRARVHERHELAGEERRLFARHAVTCSACGRLLLETERLDDLLLEWRAPDFRDADQRVMQALRGEGPAASCPESQASLHHFVAGDLEPWLAARVERHLARCANCRDHLDEVQHSRKLWRGWKAPDPPKGLADQIVARLKPETAAARRRRQFLDLVVGPVRVPRAVAALVLVSVTLLSVGVLRIRTLLPTPRPAVLSVPDAGPAPSDFAANPDYAANPVLGRVPFQPAQYVPQAGGSDPTDSFSPDLRVRRGLNQALARKRKE